MGENPSKRGPSGCALTLDGLPGEVTAGERCPTCGQAVKVFTGSEGTSSFEKLAERQLEEAREALRAIEAATEDDGGHETPVEPGDCAGCDALRLAREALARLSPGEEGTDV